MTSRRAFLSTATSLAALQPAYRDLGPILGTAARHRQVFGIRAVRDGSGFHQIKNSLNAYEFAKNEGPGTLHAIAVLYGPAVALGLDDGAWDAYAVADVLAAIGEGPKRAAGAGPNPYLRAAVAPDAAGSAADPRSVAQDASLTGLMRRGVGVLLCDNALTDFALSTVTLGHAAGAAPDAVLADFRRRLVPGAVLVPAGVAALNDAQEARYTYVAAS